MGENRTDFVSTIANGAKHTGEQDERSATAMRRAAQPPSGDEEQRFDGEEPLMPAQEDQTQQPAQQGWQQQQHAAQPKFLLGGGLDGPTPEELARRPLALRYLPIMRPWELPKSKNAPPPVVPGLQESCSAKLVLGTAGGFGMGLLFGMFLGAMGDMQPIQIINGREVPQAPLKEQARLAYLTTAQRSMGMAKNFASFSAIFMASECVIEKMRGKHDMMNSVYGGCVTGMAFGIKQGPAATVGGCVGMAAFSAVIDSVMGH